MSQQDAYMCEGKTAQICWQLWHLRSLFSISGAARASLWPELSTAQPQAPGENWGLKCSQTGAVSPSSSTYSLMDVWEYSTFFVAPSPRFSLGLHQDKSESKTWPCRASSTAARAGRAESPQQGCPFTRQVQEIHQLKGLDGVWFS